MKIAKYVALALGAYASIAAAITIQVSTDGGQTFTTYDLGSLTINSDGTTRVIANTGASQTFGVTATAAVNAVTTPAAATFLALGNYVPGETVTVTANAKAGYAFDSWAVGQGSNITCSSVAAANKCTFTMPSNAVALTANFITVQVPTHAVTATASPTAGGLAAVSGGSPQNEGAEVSVIASANAGYSFTGWTVNSGGVTCANAASTTCTFTLGTQDVSLTANFSVTAPTTYTITASASPTNGGSVSRSATSATAGTSVTLTATANAGYIFSAWNTGGVCAGQGATCAFTMPASNVSATATFTADTAPGQCGTTPAGTNVTTTNSFVSAYSQVTVSPLSPTSIASYRVTTNSTTSVLSNKVDVTRAANMDPGKWVVVSECPGSKTPVNSNSKCQWSVSDSKQVLVYTVPTAGMTTYKGTYCVVEQGSKNYYINVFNEDSAGNTTCTSGKCTFFFSIN